MSSNNRIFQLKNPHFKHMKCDYLYHLGINIENTKDTKLIQQQYGDVKIFLMGGTKGRMRNLAEYIRKLKIPGDNNEQIIDLCAKMDRYAMFKVGPVLCCSHGIGMSTFSVVLHEILKLAHYAQCEDPIFIRIGTCGGLGVEPGTVIVTENAFNGYLESVHEIAILGKKITRPAIFDKQLIDKLLQCTDPKDDFRIIKANTLATDCFYEGQGRIDGACCDYGEQDKQEFLRKCIACGIRNIEMEATMFGALTKHVGVRAADLCVTLIDRLNGDQVTVSHEKKMEFEMRPIEVAGRFIQNIITT